MVEQLIIRFIRVDTWLRMINDWMELGMGCDHCWLCDDDQ